MGNTIVMEKWNINKNLPLGCKEKNQFTWQIRIFMWGKLVMARDPHCQSLRLAANESEASPQ